jgi:transcriptional coactivator HFI1/ADA1
LDLEIRKRYTAPLSVETHEFPDATSIAARMLPICYENGLPQGHSAECPTFMNIATETYIKEALTSLFQRVSINGPGYIKTAEYKRRVEKEEAAVARGELNKTAGGLLPVEQEEMRKRRPLCMEDLRLCNIMGDSYLGQTPCISGQITNGRFLDAPGVEELENEQPVSPQRPRERAGTVTGKTARPVPERSASSVAGALAAAAAPANGMPFGKKRKFSNSYGFHVDLGDPPVVMDDDWPWLGATAQDVQALDSVLDGLIVGT